MNTTPLDKKTIKQHSILCLASIALIGCAAHHSDLKPMSHIMSDTQTVNFQDYNTSAWVSEKFDGAFSRQFKGKTLYYNIAQSAPEGGVDIGLSQRDVKLGPVAEVVDGLVICSSYKTKLSGEGRWWAGPKISVNWAAMEEGTPSQGDWYENYIVEIASSTPNELHDIFTGDYFKGEDLGMTKLAGASYRHYKIRYQTWWQYWSVRQDYRESGVLPLEPIIDVWVQNGLPTNLRFDGVKANIETYGEISGTGETRVDIGKSTRQDLVCD